jgi:fumarate reductase subunit C
MSARDTYVRPMRGWWRRNPFFVRYMAREATAIFVYLYALLLIAGLVALRNGPASFDAWLGMLRNPFVMSFLLASQGVFAYHTLSWFRIMPKTMPPVRFAGRRVAAAAITAAGLAAAAIASGALIALGLA